MHWMSVTLIIIHFQIGSAMSKKLKKQQGFWGAVVSYVVEHIAIEEKKRSRLLSVVVYLHYLVDYLILWAIIQLVYNSSAAVPFDWPLIVARCLFSALFLIFKHPFFFLGNKLVILVQITVAQESFILLEVLAGLGEVAMSAVWALTKEQRMIHFDSRFQIFGAFLKQCVIYCILTVQAFFAKGAVQLDNQFLFLGALFLLLLVDFAEVYYSRLTKLMFLRLDYILILLTVVTIYKEAVAIGYVEFLFASLFLFLVAGLHLAFTPANKSTLFKFNSQEIKNLSEDTMIEILIYLKKHTQGRDFEGIETYLYKLKEESEDPLFIEKIQECEEKDALTKRELLSNFIFQTLKKGAKSSRRLRDLVIYLYSPSPRLYCFLDLDDWQHLREYKRIIAEELNDSTLREAEAEKELEEVKKVIEKYTRVSNILLQELMKERIKERKVEVYGEQLIELLEELQKISASEHSNSAEVRVLINRFAFECLPAKYHSSIVRQSEQQADAIREDYGEVVFGAEEDNYLTVLEANNCFTKLSYFRKEKYMGRHVSEFLPPSFIAHLTRELKNFTKIEEKPEAKSTYLFNSLGFAVICRFRVESTTHRSGRAWKLFIKQEMLDKTVLVLTSDGNLDGFTELCRYYGLEEAHKDKRVSPDILKQLEGSSSVFLRIGENLFASCEFHMAKSATLNLLEEIAVDGHRTFLVELRQSDTKSKSFANASHNEAKEPPAFEFHYDWAGRKITTESYPQIIRFNSCFHEEERQVVNYGENITEMRYYQEKIDYKSNFEEERDCQSLQPHLERALSSLSINEFYEKWDRKKNSVPLWFKVSAVLVALISILTLASAIYFLLQFNAIAANAGNSLQVTTKLQEKLQSVILLGELTTLPFYNSSLNVSQAINAQISHTNQISSELYALNQNIFNLNGGQGILDLLNTLNLYMNSYLLNANYSYKTILSLITAKINPNFMAFIQSLIDAYNSASTGFQRNAILICFSVICLGLFVIMWLVDFRQTFRRREIADILKFIDNEDLQVIRDRIVRFKETWLDNVDCKEFEEDEEVVRENISPPKHLINSLRLRRRKVFHFSWIALFIVLLVLINGQIEAFWQLSSNYISFENSLSSEVTNLQSVWAELNNPAPNVTLIQTLIMSSVVNAYNKNSMLKFMASHDQIEQNFVNRYGAFWESEKCCDYFNDSRCISIIGGAMAEGANMAICFLNIQQDSYLANGMANFSLYSQATFPYVALISLYYLPVITTANNAFILEEYNLMLGQYTLVVQYYFIGIVLHSLLVLLLFHWMMKERRTNSRIEELLMVMPFEKLKNFSAFHKYYLKYYANY